MSASVAAQVARALRDGVLVRPAACSACGNPGRVDGHHDDYAKPLDVRWLCASCHRAWHSEHGHAPGRKAPENPNAYPPIYVRAPADMRDRLDDQAAYERRTISAVVVIALEEYFEAHPLSDGGAA